MNRPGWIAMALCFVVWPAAAQAPPDASALQAAPAKPEFIIGGPSPPPMPRERCVEVEIGGARSFGCLNQQLKREADRANPITNIAPLDAKSSDTKIGIVNLPGVQQQYGRNYGVSVMPYRPPSASPPGVRP